MPSRTMSAVTGWLVLTVLFTFALAPRSTVAIETVTAAYETVLRAGPTADAAVVAAISPGSALTLVGAPAGNVYPVSFNGTIGWVEAGALTITKGASEGAPVPAESPLMPFEGAVTPAGDGQPLPPAEPAAAAPSMDPAALPTPTGAEVIATAVAATSGDPLAIATAAAREDDPGLAEPTPASALQRAAPPEPEVVAAPATGVATPLAVPSVAPDPTPVPVPVSTVAPTPSPTPNPEPVLETWGPATAASDLSLFAAPSTGSGVLFYVPAGSTLSRTGTINGEFVSADFMGIVGWVHQDSLEQPEAPAAEAVPAESPLPVRTPRPGSGVAFTTVDLTLRAGPSANEAAIGTVPAGERVVLTGVMENDFQRVEYREQVGWLADAYLSTPANPEPAMAPPGVGGERPGRDPRGYSETEIIRIIYAAADRYGQPRAEMLRVARCESALDPNAVNPSGSYGLFQFIRSTWKSTPYGGEDIFDPQANANAAGWMWSVGRRNEWVCQ